MTQDTVDYRKLMSKALLEIKDLKARLQRQQDERAEPIAIVGMACRFPGGANSPEIYWDMLREGVDAISEVPAQRWDIERLHDSERTAAGKMSSRFGGFIDDISGFDAAFFGISPREAESLDPHQRILLEVCWEALEHANIVPESLYGSSGGVFIGVSSMDQVINQMGAAALADIGPYHGTGCAMAPIAGRVSYTFGLNGPSFVVDTACSSSLLSLHLAAESLRRRECNLALAGGVHLLFHPGYSVAFSKAGMLAVDGRCKTFDAKADGYVRGEGCGVVVLKRLSDAQRDGDNILALLRGSAVNQDGASGGLTVPSGPSQEQVVRQALARAGIEAAGVTYVEAHGTGTPLGDPIELGALGNVFKQPLLVGSVKSNIGHLEASAGIASAIKVTLALQHATIPPHLHLHKPNPLIPWQDLSIKVPTQLTPWPETDERIAGISAFGFSGTNVHMLLSQAPAPVVDELASLPVNATVQKEHLLVLSARSEDALRALAKRWADGPLSEANLDLAEYCAAAALSRTAFPYRLAVAADSVVQARTMLEDFAAHGNVATGAACANTEKGRPSVAFLFTGQGSQYVGMARELYVSEPVFKAAVDECERLLQQQSGLSIVSLLYPENDADIAACATQLDATGNTQPALFVIEYALAQLWAAYGVTPDAVLGHSVGEYVAAHLAGVFSLADALRLIAARGKLMQALPAGGGMAAIFADVNKIEAELASFGGKLAVAAYNGARNTVISGAQHELEQLLERFKAQGIKCRSLAVSHAFHSPLMEPMLAEFARVAAGVTYHPPRITVISNVSGKRGGDELATAEYWVRHVRQPVRFAEGVQALVAAQHRFMIEVGPSATLVDMARQNLEDQPVALISSLRKDKPQRLTLLAALGEYWANGGEVNWSALGMTAQRHVHLPTYPFVHRHYWQNMSADATGNGLHGVRSLDLPLLARQFRSPLLRETLFETVFSKKALPFIEDHRVFGQLVVAGASHLSLVLSAAALHAASGAMHKNAACTLSDVMFPMALVVPEDGECVAQLAIGLAADQGEAASFRLMGLHGEDEPSLHAKGNIVWGGVPEAMPDLDAIRKRCTEQVPVAAVYDLQRQRHIVVGPSYQWLSNLQRGRGETLATLSAPAVLGASIHRYSLHPGLIDSCFGALVMAHTMEIEETFIPFALGELHFSGFGGGMQTLIAHAVVRQHDDMRLVGDIHIYTENGQPVATFIGLEGRRASRRALLSASSAALNTPALHAVEWEEMPVLAALSPARQRWLILCESDNGIGAHLASRLKNSGANVTQVLADSSVDGLKKLDAGRYALNPVTPAAFVELLRDGTHYDAVCYLWGLGAQNDIATEQGFVAYQQTACAGALHLLQALATHPAKRVWLVTQSVQSVLPDDILNQPQQALLWGLGAVAAAEHPELSCVCLDLQAGQDVQRAVVDLFNATTYAADESRIAMREGKAWAARLVAQTQSIGNAPSIDVNGNYLITGVNGAIGRRLAVWLAQRGVRHLALVARGAPDTVLLAELEKLGASPKHYRADVADRESLAAVITQAEQQAPLHAVFHLAGIIDDGMITTQNWERVSKVMAAKAAGAWNLHQLTATRSLPLFVGFSSAAALLGNAGQASYAAANAFVDALALHRQASGSGGTSLSIAWGPWADVGMAAGLNEEQTARLAAQGVFGMDADAALTTMGALLGENHRPHIGAMAISWPDYVQAHPSPFLSRLAQAEVEPIAVAREQLLLAAPAARQTLLSSILIGLVADVLRLSPKEVDPREGLFDLGIDSLLALELKSRLQNTLGMPLSSTLLFDYPTIETLSVYLLDALLPKHHVQVADATPAPISASVNISEDIDALSDEEAEALLLAQLEQLEVRTS